MEDPSGQRHGFLLDVAPDGFGYLVEEFPTAQTYVVEPTMFEGPVESPDALEGYRVVFQVEDGRPVRIRLSNAAAAGAEPLKP